MANVTVTNKIQGMNYGNPRAPSMVATYKYHLHMERQDEAYEIGELLVQKDEPTFVTSDSRPNMFLVYSPLQNNQDKWSFRQMAYYECVKILYGPHGKNYYVFGSGKVFRTLPESID